MLTARELKTDAALRDSSLRVLATLCGHPELANAFSSPYWRYRQSYRSWMLGHLGNGVFFYDDDPTEISSDASIIAGFPHRDSDDDEEYHTWIRVPGLSQTSCEAAAFRLCLSTVKTWFNVRHTEREELTSFAGSIGMKTGPCEGSPRRALAIVRTDRDPRPVTLQRIVVNNQNIVAGVSEALRTLDRGTIFPLPFGGVETHPHDLGVQIYREDETTEPRLEVWWKKETLARG